MRRLYAKIGRRPRGNALQDTQQQRTMKSGIVPEWQSSFWVDWLGKASFFWDLVYRFQFNFFKDKARWGHEMIILAKKSEIVTTHG